MLEDEFEGYNPDEIEDIGLGPEEETENLFEETSETTESINLEGKYWIRIYHKASTKEKSVERDVTDLLKNEPHTSLVELIKYVSERQKDGVERRIAAAALADIKVFEDKGALEYITGEECLGIRVLDKEKQSKVFYENFIKVEPGMSSGLFPLPTTSAIDYFEKRPEEGLYRLDINVNIEDVGGG